MTAALPVKRIFSLKPRSQTPFHQCSHYPQTCGFQRFKAPNLRRSTESCGAPQMATADPNTAAPRRPKLAPERSETPWGWEISMEYWNVVTVISQLIVIV